jgi:recombination protein RecT
MKREMIKMANEVANSKPKFSVVIQSDAYKKLINNTLGDQERARRFVASISSAVATNPALQECDSGSILSAALLGESLNLSPSPQLGHYYLVPYKNTKKGTTDAQFQLGWHGYYQLAIRSGQYKDLDVIEIREGEYLGRDKVTGKQNFSFIENESERLSKPIIGYLGYFELLNGYRKQIYMSKEEMEQHADTYSKAFSLADYKKLQAGKIPEKDLWKYSSYWYKDFDGMAFKTILRRLISKYGVMSIEMQDAYTKDMAVLHENGDYEYVDNPQEEDKTTIDVKEEKPTKLDEV